MCSHKERTPLSGAINQPLSGISLPGLHKQTDSSASEGGTTGLLMGQGQVWENLKRERKGMREGERERGDERERERETGRERERERERERQGEGLSLEVVLLHGEALLV